MLSTVYYTSLPGKSFFFQYLIWNLKHCFPSRRFSCVISSATVSCSYWWSALRMNLIVMAGGLESLMAWKYWSCIIVKFLLAFRECETVFAWESEIENSNQREKLKSWKNWNKDNKWVLYFKQMKIYKPCVKQKKNVTYMAVLFWINNYCVPLTT